MWRKELSYSAGWECKIMQLLWKIVWQFLKNVNNSLWPSNSTQPLQAAAARMPPKCAYTKNYVQMFKASIIRNSKMCINWLINRCAISIQWNSTQPYKRKEVQTHATVWMNFEIIMLSEGEKVSHARPHMIPLIWNVQIRQIHRDRVDSWLLGREREGGWRGSKTKWLLTGMGFIFPWGAMIKMF